MRAIDKMKLIGQVALKLQEQMTYTQIDSYFTALGLDCSNFNGNTNSKRVYAEEFLSDKDTDVIIKIADELEVQHEIISEEKVIDNDPSNGFSQRIQVYLNNVLNDLTVDSTSKKINRYSDFYIGINTPLKNIFSFYHFQLNNLFQYLNSRLSNGHFTADESRELIRIIDEIESLQNNVQNSDFSFRVIDDYQKRLEECKVFLSPSGGSTIPETLTKIEIKEMEPIFILETSLEVKRGKVKFPFKIQLIDEGSYAKVFKYHDEFYNRTFAIKRAKKDLTVIEQERFRKEYSVMKELNSPYVVEVYNFNEEKLEYVMEFADDTMEKFIKKNNAKLSMLERINLINQTFRAFTYIESRKILHRDISTNNVLLKFYDDLKVIKLSDFGLVKDGTQNLTNTNTKIKGSFNDPQLATHGFKNYEIRHETYALTRLVYYILTGKTIWTNFSNNTVNDFFNRGTSVNIDSRYKSVVEMKTEFSRITQYLK